MISILPSLPSGPTWSYFSPLLSSVRWIPASFPYQLQPPCQRCLFRRQTCEFGGGWWLMGQGTVLGARGSALEGCRQWGALDSRWNEARAGEQGAGDTPGQRGPGGCVAQWVVPGVEAKAAPRGVWKERAWTAWSKRCWSHKNASAASMR